MCFMCECMKCGLCVVECGICVSVILGGELIFVCGN